nr:PREDICTED: uncharacterized protein LOC100879367 isoform X4 [Megachile rotundata]
MNSVRFASTENTENRNLQRTPENVFNWRMSYSVIKSRQENVVLQQKYSYLLYSRKKRLRNACPADIKMLKLETDFDQDLHSKSKDSDSDLEEYEARFDEYASELGQLETQKLKTWDEYKKLVELTQVKPKIRKRSPLVHITSLPRLQIYSEKFISLPRRHGRAKRSIIKLQPKQTILIADTNYVQFRNFNLNRLYKQTVTLQNVSTLPARFQIEPRPYRSNFRVIIKRSEGTRNIVPPGMQFQLIILFRCNEVDEPEELLVLKVENGKPLVIKLHGYKEPPILLGTCLPSRKSLEILQSNVKWVVEPWQPESSSSSEESTDASEESVTYSIESWETIHNKFVSTTFDCRIGFVGETVYVPIRFKNVGGGGRFFIMSEISWTSMYIQDVTDKNVLKLSRFTVYPAYFKIKSKERMILHTTFSPDSYGVHVDKVYVLCNNCTILATEIIGDGVIFEQNLIQIDKKLTKDRSKKDLDKRANYCINLSTSAPNIFGQCTITVTNTSEIRMYFRWEKRDIESDENEIDEYNYFPLKSLFIQPEQGIFAPTSIHHFTVIAEYSNLQPNIYFAVLQLYVEDIPEMAVSNNLLSHVQECTNRQRSCGNSVDVWIDDVEVWLEYKLEDQIKSDQAFDEIAERITGKASYYKDFIEDQYEGTEYGHDDEYKSTSQLLIDELFAHYDILNLKQFVPHWRERTITMGIIRPTRTLYIGIEETCVLTIKNLSDKALIYSWGEVNGEDAEKVKVCACPEKGEVSGRTSEKIKITLTPIKEGIVQSLYMPCFIGGSQKIIILGVECYIEPLYVTFYFPLTDKEPVKLKNNFIQVEWRMNSLQLAFDLAGTSTRGIKLLDKYRAREEEELMTANLDQGDVLKDASAGPSISEVAAEDSGEEFTLSTRTSEIIQMSNLVTGNGRSSDVSSGDIVPFFQTTLPSGQQPVVLEFLNLPLRTVEKKTFIIKNETSIPTNFQIDLKNFYPTMCSCEGLSLEDRIKSIYKRVHCKQKSLLEDTMSRVKQPKSGVVIYVDPVNSYVGSFEAVPVNIYVYGDTWGIYVDKLEINIRGLPLYTLEICVQVVGLPIWLSISDKGQSKIPVIKYGTTMTGVRLQERKIIVWNNSIIPIAINWHSFIIKPQIEKMPFNVVFDICTSFTDKVASDMRASKLGSVNEIPVQYENCCSKLENSKIHEFDSMGTNVDSDSITGYTYSGSSYMAISWKSNYESLYTTEISIDYTSQSITRTSKSIFKHEQDEDTAFLDINHHNIAQETGDTEIKVSILPYYGSIDTKAGAVAPREMFLLPDKYAFLTINVQPEKLKKNYEGELFCKILGFLRIAPSDKYRDNYYFRQDGNYLSPIEIDVTANIIHPKLTFNIPKINRTFVCCAYDVMQSEGKKLELVQTFFLHNHKPETVRVMFETYKPFHIKSVAIYARTNPCKLTGVICINPKGCAEVVVVCIVDAQFIETIIHTSKSQDMYDSVITITEPLQITHTDKTQQVSILIIF